MKKLILLIIIIGGLYHLATTPGNSVHDKVAEFQSLNALYHSYQESPMETTSLSSQITSYNRAIIVSNGSKAYLIFSNGTYYAIRSETTYIVTGNLGVLLWTQAGARTTLFSRFAQPFSNIDLINPLLSYISDTSIDLQATYSSNIFMTTYPTSIVFTSENGVTYFTLDGSVTVTYYPASG